MTDHNQFLLQFHKLQGLTYCKHIYQPDHNTMMSLETRKRAAMYMLLRAEHHPSETARLLDVSWDQFYRLKTDGDNFEGTAEERGVYCQQKAT